MSRRRSRPVRLARGALWALAVGHLVELAMLRHKRDRLAPLGAPDGPATAAGSVATPDAPVQVITAGAGIDDEVLERVVALMAAEGVESVDLVPGDLPADRLLRVLRRLNARRLADDVLYAPGGAHDTLVIAGDLAGRARLDGAIGCDRGQVVRDTREAQRSAPTAKALRFAPDLAGAPWSPAERWRELQELCTFYRPIIDLAPVMVALETAHLAAMTAGLLVAPGPAAAAIATWSAQPALALAGHEGAHDAGRGSVLRLADRWAENLRTWAAYREARRANPEGVGPWPPPLEERFEAPVEACPWCGSASLVGQVDTYDLNQFKPGVFHLDRCTDCGHIFQNPQVSPAGLDYYYADVYDGFGEEMLEFGLSTQGKLRLYKGRIDLVAAATEPTAWLDVGTGHGHFCLVARQRWPEARFDAIDQSDSVLQAERRGRIDTAHRGQFPDMAEKLAGAYDVLSMNHYLEHATDPRREIAAAATVLAPGGHLLIEGPDAASPWKRVGKYWICWLQPQHLHFITCEGLIAELEQAGFEVVAVERAPASEGSDLTMAASLFAQHRAGPGRLPWHPPRTLAQRVRRGVVLGSCIPLIVAAMGADIVKDVWQMRPGSPTPGNAYRLVARRL
jgi:SAM-dependent methyltransferase